MQLWDDSAVRIKDAATPERYLRILCFNAAHYAENAARQRTGYNGRKRAISQIEASAKGYVVVSVPPQNKKHGAGVWGKYADLSKAYPILSVERDENGNVYVVVGTPVSMSTV